MRGLGSWKGLTRLRCSRRAVLFALVCLACLAAVTALAILWPRPQLPYREFVRQNVEVTLELDKARYSFGEPIIVTVFGLNRHYEPLLVFTDDLYRDGFVITDPDGKALPYIQPSYQGTAMGMKLPPGIRMPLSEPSSYCAIDLCETYFL